MIKRINAGKNFFFFFFFAVFDILLRLLRDAPKPSHQLHPDRARVLSQVLPADGALSRGWSPVTPPPLKKNPNSFAALGLWIKRQELECWLLQKWQCHHLNVTSGAQQAVGVSLSVSGRETVSLKCGVLSIVMLRLWECVCMFGMTSSLITM